MGHSTRKIQRRYTHKISHNDFSPVWKTGPTVTELQMCMCSHLKCNSSSVSADAPGTIMSQKFAMMTGLMDKHSRPRVNALQQFMLYGSPLVFVQIKWRLYDVAVSSGAGIYVSRMYDPYSILFSNSAAMMFDGVDIILGPDQVAVLRSQGYTVNG